MEKKRDFLINTAYWLVIGVAVYLSLKYVMPVSVPFILGILVAWIVVWISRKIHCTHKLFRIGLSILIYGVLALLITLAVTKGVSAVTVLVKWLPKLYESKLLPFVTLCYEWSMQTLQRLDPALLSALQMVLETVVSALKNLVSYLSGFAVNVVSGVATGIPSVVLSLLAMIFSTIFMVSDYEKIVNFARENIPEDVKKVLRKVRTYLKDTLFVVIRSYILIMILTFTELSILFSVFGIQSAVAKAAAIAVMDVMPILGTGGVMIPWAVISFVLGNTVMGIKLTVIYAVVTVVRNYVEPKIVGAQLGLHSIITLTSMFIGLRLFGFWGLFGLPVGISFLWKEHKEKKEMEILR